MQAVVVGNVVDVAVLAGDVDPGPPERGRGVEVVAVAQRGIGRRGVERPAPAAGGGVERVELAVGGADVEDLAVPRPGAAPSTGEERIGSPVS